MASDTYYVPLRVIRPRWHLGHEVKIKCDPAVGVLFAYASMEDLRADYPDIHLRDVMELAKGGDDGTD